MTCLNDFVAINNQVVKSWILKYDYTLVKVISNIIEIILDFNR